MCLYYYWSIPAINLRIADYSSHRESIKPTQRFQPSTWIKKRIEIATTTEQDSGGGVLLEEGYGIAFFYQGNELEL